MNMSAQMPPAQFRLFRHLVWRDYRAKFSYIWIYVLAALILAITAFAVQGFYRSFETETVQVARDPLLPVHALVLAALALSFGLRASASIATERENRTLEVLLAGPVNMATFVIAKAATEFLALLSLLSLYVVYVLMTQPIGGIAVASQSSLNVFYLSVHALPFLGFGMLISSMSASVRSAMIMFTVAALALVSLEVLTAWLNVQNPNDLSLSALYVKGFLEPFSRILMWISPAAYLVAAIKSAVGVGALPVAYNFAAMLCFLMSMLASCWLSARRGAT